MIRYLFASIALIAFSTSCYAQGYINQSGSITAGHAAKWTAHRTLQDAGPASGGNANVGITELPIVNTGSPLCIYDSPITNALGYHSLCFGSNVSGKTQITVAAGGSATPADLVFNINGIEYGFPGPGNGNVMGPNPSTLDALMCWNNALGTLSKDCGTTASRFRGATNVSGLQTVSTPATGRFGGYAQNLITINDTAWTTEVVPPYAPPIIGLEVDQISGGVTNTDTTHTAIVGYSALLSNNVAAGKNEYWQGAYLVAGGNSSAGGTPGSEKGMAWGLNSEVALYSGATNWYALTGIEVDVRVNAGANVVQRLGVWIADVGTGAQGSGAIDCALCIGSSAVSPGFKYGILFTSFAGGGQNVTDAVMAVDHALSVTNILNFGNVTCTSSWALAFGNGFAVTCGGGIELPGGIKYLTGGTPLVLGTAADTGINLQIDSGLTVGQTSSISLSDRGVIAYSMYKDATNRLLLDAAGGNIFTFVGTPVANLGFNVPIALPQLTVAQLALLTCNAAMSGRAYQITDGNAAWLADVVAAGAGALWQIAVCNSTAGLWQAH